MPGKYKEISEQTRQNFIDAFWQLYEKKDINKIKVQEICDIAGYHRNTFYHYFADVYDVLNQIEDRIIEELMENSDYRMFFNEDEAISKKFAAIYEKHKKYLCILADENKGSGFALKMKNVLKPFYSNIFAHNSNRKENIYISEFKLTGTIAAIMYYFRGEEKFSLEDLMKLMIELTVDGKWSVYNDL